MSSEGSELANDHKLQKLLDRPEEMSEVAPPNMDCADRVIQQTTRALDGNREWITSSHQLTFAAGQNRQIIHIPFVPALKDNPEVQTHVTDHEDVRIRVTDRQKFGVRAEVVLTVEPKESTDRSIEFVISSETG